MRRFAIVGFLLVLAVVVAGSFIIGKRFAQRTLPTNYEPASTVSTTLSLPENIRIVDADKRGYFYEGEFRIMTVQPSIKRQIGETGATQNVTILGLTVDKIDEDTVQVKGDEVSRYTVRTSYMLGGILAQLAFQVVDQVWCVGCGQDGAVMIPVKDLPLTPGSIINVGFTFIPNENPLSPAAVEKFCQFMKDSNCDYAQETGFGTKPVTFSDYVAGLYENESDNLLIDPGVAYVSMISIRTVTNEVQER